MQAMPETCHVDYNICILKSLVVPYAGYSRNVACGLQHMYSLKFTSGAAGKEGSFGICLKVCVLSSENKREITIVKTDSNK
jgi:hypothetical protein